MTRSFSAQVSKLTANYDRRLTAVLRQSVQDVAQEASRPRGEGGRMRVDTGFLRNSISAAVGSVPTGPGTPSSKGDPGNESASEDVALVLAQAVAGGPDIYVGWTADYAGVRNYKDGFLTAAAQNWPKYVRKNATRAERLIK